MKLEARLVTLLLAQQASATWLIPGWGSSKPQEAIAVPQPAEDNQTVIDVSTLQPEATSNVAPTPAMVPETLIEVGNPSPTGATEMPTQGLLAGTWGFIFGSGPQAAPVITEGEPAVSETAPSIIVTPPPTDIEAKQEALETRQEASKTAPVETQTWYEWWHGTSRPQAELPQIEAEAGTGSEPTTAESATSNEPHACESSTVTQSVATNIHEDVPEAQETNSTRSGSEAPITDSAQASSPLSPKNVRAATSARLSPHDKKASMPEAMPEAKILDSTSDHADQALPETLNTASSPLTTTDGSDMTLNLELLPPVPAYLNAALKGAVYESPKPDGLVQLPITSLPGTNPLRQSGPTEARVLGEPFKTAGSPAQLRREVINELFGILAAADSLNTDYYREGLVFGPLSVKESARPKARELRAAVRRPQRSSHAHDLLLQADQAPQQYVHADELRRAFLLSAAGLPVGGSGSVEPADSLEAFLLAIADFEASDSESPAAQSASEPQVVPLYSSDSEHGFVEPDLSDDEPHAAQLCSADDIDQFDDAPVFGLRSPRPPRPVASHRAPRGHGTPRGNRAAPTADPEFQLPRVPSAGRGRGTDKRRSPVASSTAPSKRPGPHQRTPDNTRGPR